MRGVQCAALMCHAPIVVPDVGGTRGRECARTTAAMHAVARRVADHRPDVLCLLSPHTPRIRGHVGVFGGRGLEGSFARFGAPECGLVTQAAPRAVTAFVDAAASFGLPTREAELEALDHGALVPLWFLHAHLAETPVVLLSLPHAATLDAEATGAAIRQAAESSATRWAVIASGDMSHRLRPGAPAGYEPRAADFDRDFVHCLQQQNYRAAVRPDPALRELAAEDVVDTTHAALAAVGYRSQGSRVYAYEAPFGVGYCEALLHTETFAGAQAQSTG